MSKPAISAFDFFERFPDEKTARGYFEGRRWPHGINCPLCGGDNNSPRKGREGFYHCNDCKRTFSAKSGTVMGRSKIKIRAWLYAMHLLATAHKSASSLHLSRELGVTQKTAWWMLHRIREACGGRGGLLRGDIEADETDIGGKKKDKHQPKRRNAKRGTADKAGVTDLKERVGEVRAMPPNGEANTDRLKSTSVENVSVAALYAPTSTGGTRT